MFIYAEDGSMSSVVSLGVLGLLGLLVHVHKIPSSISSIPGDVASVFPGATSMFPIIFYVGSTIYVLK